MNSDSAPPIADDTDAGEPKRKTIARTSRRGQSRVEVRRRVGDYRVIALLGEGGMAQVHLAVKHGPAGFKKLLVVKSMRDDLVDPIYVKSFMHEARLAAQLNHPNVIQTYEVGEDEGQLFIAMEYVEGQSMRAVQRRLAPKRLPLNVQLRILAELARGMHHAHTLSSFDGTPLQIVHRDVSPQNVMITYDGQIKLLDFGIAKAQGGSDELTREGMIKGKIDYMAPEQLRGDVVDQRADVFALGVMLWEALTGLRFSGGAEVAEITKMHNRIMGREQKLRNVAPDTPMRLVEICEKAISLDVKDRFLTAEDFERAIAEYLSDTSTTTDSQQLSQIMEGLFATERQKLRKLLEEQLRAMSEADEAGEDVELLFVDEGDVGTGTPSSQSNMLARSGHRQLTEESDVADETARANTRAWQLAIASVVVAGGLLAGIYLTPNRAAPARAPEETAPPAISSSVLTTQATTTVHVRIEASPANATATLDGVRIDLPFDARLTPESQLHRLEVRADGFETISRGISMTEDMNVHISLEPLADERIARATGRVGTARSVPTDTPVTQTAHAPTPSPAEPTPSPQVAETPQHRSPPIESSNPYE